MLVNIVFTVIIGSLLHFTFDFFNQSLVVGLFSAVNESVWEHLKLVMMPMALLALWQGIVLKKKPNNFWLSRAKAIYLAPIIIVALFYGYTVILGKNYLVLDIAIFIIAVIVAELIAKKITRMDFHFGKKSRAVDLLSKISILLAVILFAYFTFCPPQNFLFEDPTNDGYSLESIENISLPKGYTLKNYAIEEILDISCLGNRDCETPFEYSIQSRCPFVSLCLKRKCTVVCPVYQGLL
jgi:hypothetical protein